MQNFEIHINLPLLIAIGNANMEKSIANERKNMNINKRIIFLVSVKIDKIY